jgi:hypothetical protein
MILVTRVATIFAWLALALSVSSCATYQVKVDEARRLFATNPDRAQEQLKPLALNEGRDQLVYLLDYATALQAAGRYEESIKIFLQAERLSELVDYHSVSKVATSLALGEELVQYKGEDFEKVLINNMNAMNFLALGQLEEALVEVRRVNEKLYKLKIDGKKNFNQSPLAFYLGAIIWESDKKYDDAYIAYKNAYEVAPDFQPLREDLIRAAIRAQRTEDLVQWKKKFPEVVIKPEWNDRNVGEIVVVYLHGWGPRKQPRPDSPRFPKLVSVTTEFPDFSVAVFRKGSERDDEFPVAKSKGNPIYSVDSVALQAMEADYARLVGSRVAGLATKAVIADQIRQKDEAMGKIAWLAMNLADRADLRQWSTLPSSFSIARVPVKAGKYSLRMTGNRPLQPSEELLKSDSPMSQSRNVSVRGQQKTFVIWRGLR